MRSGKGRTLAANKTKKTERGAVISDEGGEAAYRTTNGGAGGRSGVGYGDVWGVPLGLVIGGGVGAVEW